MVALREYPDLDPLILEAFLAVKREFFVPKSDRAQLRGEALHLPFDIQPLNTRLAPPILHLIALRALQIQPGMDCLDIGCGTGYTTALLHAIATSSASARVLGIDLSPGLVEIARTILHRVYPTSAQLLTHNAFDEFPAPMNLFDRIYAGAQCHRTLLFRLSYVNSFPSSSNSIVH